MDMNIVNWRKYGDHTKLNMCGCVFSLHDMPDRNTCEIKFRILNFECNDVFLVCKDHDICDGPFRIKLDESLNLNGAPVQFAQWDAEDRTLQVNKRFYRIVDSDFCYFVSDFMGNEQKALDSVMTYFAQALVEGNVI